MAVFSYKSMRHPVMLKITIETKKPTPIRIMAKDPDRPLTFYMDRYNTINGRDCFYVRLPKSPDVVAIRIVNDNSKDDQGFKIVEKDGLPYEKLPLTTKMDLKAFSDPNMASFINFAEKFSERAGYTGVGRYLSDDSKYEIEYNQKIVDKSSGTELNTPARINSVTGKVEVSKDAFTKYTISGRFAILLHEFSHVFANKNVKDEMEADFHAAQIYLALGYPRIELLNVFGKVFLGADTELNRRRFDLLKKYVLNFDDNIYSVKY
jgi:hypothetical protein